MNICVFGASSDRLAPAYYEAAHRLGVLIARGGCRLIFGGGREGLMGACARGVLSEGGRPLGVAPRFFDEPGVLMTGECDFLFTETMAGRKARMEDEADAFIALPGGIGTFEELLEVLTLRQLGRHGKPIALLNTLGYFDALETMLREASEKGFMSAEVHGLYALCPDPETAFAHASRSANGPCAPRPLSSYSR